MAVVAPMSGSHLTSMKEHGQWPPDRGQVRQLDLPEAGTTSSDGRSLKKYDASITRLCSKESLTVLNLGLC